MTDKELMVNDFVLWNGKIARIETIWLNSHAVKLIVGKDKIYRDAFLTDIKPIPITPEILKKNGFYYDTEDDSFIIRSSIYGNLIYQIRICNIDDKGYFQVYILTDLCSTTICIEYVHDLQHLLRLCKVDKEIKL